MRAASQLAVVLHMHCAMYFKFVIYLAAANAVLYRFCISCVLLGDVLTLSCVSVNDTERSCHLHGAWETSDITVGWRVCRCTLWSVVGLRLHSLIVCIIILTAAKDEDQLFVQLLTICHWFKEKTLHNVRSCPWRRLLLYTSRCTQAILLYW